MLESATRMMLIAASSAVHAEGVAHLLPDGAAHALEVDLVVEVLGGQPPVSRQASVVVGFGSALAVGHGAGQRAADCGPTLREPASSIQAIEPPPLPISTMSTTGAMIG